MFFAFALPIIEPIHPNEKLNGAQVHRPTTIVTYRRLVASFLFDVLRPLFNVPCMNTTDQSVPVVAGVNLPLSAHRKWSAVWIMLVLLTFCAARADAQDKDHLVIYGIMGQADTLSAGGQTSQAHAKYAEAQLALARFQRENPAWNIKTVSFRLNYLAEKLAATAAKTVAPENNT